MSRGRGRRGRSILCLTLALVGAACAGGDNAGGESPAAATDPTDEAQYLLTLVNAARVDPLGELDRLLAHDDPDIVDALAAFGVDLDQLRTDLSAAAPRPPLAWDGGLAAAAERHATDMAIAGFQSHLGSDGSRPPQRLRDAGVDDIAYSTESVTAYARTLDYAHASFLVDWGGPPPSGVIGWPDPPHRQALLGLGSTAETLDQVGIAVRPAEDDGVGPLVVVHEYADGPDVFVVGTVYADRDGDGRYGVGEGLGGVAVASGAARTETAPSGGYALPVTGLTGELTVGFTGGGLDGTEERTVVLTGVNVLLDLTVADPVGRTAG